MDRKFDGSGIRCCGPILTRRFSVPVGRIATGLLYVYVFAARWPVRFPGYLPLLTPPRLSVRGPTRPGLKEKGLALLESTTIPDMEVWLRDVRIRCLDELGESDRANLERKSLLVYRQGPDSPSGCMELGKGCSIR